MKKFKEVFVIDDDKIFHFLISNLFKKNNLDITPSFFFNGLEAIEKIKKNINLGLGLPDVILLDINMPIMDGWQFLDEFRKYNEGTNKKPHVYIISSSDSISDTNKAKEYQDQIEEYILKPITTEGFKKIF
jgi:CheY-like chemotaxis protein